MILLIDIGNTRIKWAALEAGVLGAQRAESHANWDAQDVQRHIIQSATRPQRVLVSNVGGPRMGEAVREAALKAWDVSVEFLRSTQAAGGVRNAYPEPGNLGVDRWLAMIGARSMYSDLLCVVSIGTAMTVDALSASGVHLGGTITPGPDLMISSLLRGTSDLASRSANGAVNTSVFSDNTRGAIAQGVVHALAALIDRSVAELQKSQHTMPRVLLTGGASAQVKSFITAPAEQVPDLVLRGLAVLA